MKLPSKNRRGLGVAEQMGGLVTVEDWQASVELWRSGAEKDRAVWWVHSCLAAAEFYGVLFQGDQLSPMRQMVQAPKTLLSAQVRSLASRL